MSSIKDTEKFDRISKNIIENLPNINAVLADSELNSKVTSDEIVKDIENLAKDVIIKPNLKGERLTVTQIDDLFKHLRSNQKITTRPSTVPRLNETSRTCSNPNITTKPMLSDSVGSNFTAFSSGDLANCTSLDIENILGVIHTNKRLLSNINKTPLKDVEINKDVPSKKFQNAIEKIEVMFKELDEKSSYMNNNNRTKDKIHISTELNDLLKSLNQVLPMTFIILLKIL